MVMRDALKAWKGSMWLRVWLGGRFAGGGNIWTENYSNEKDGKKK